MTLDIYKDHVAALSGQMSAVTAVQSHYVDAINALTLVAPPDVLKAVHAFTDDAFIEHSGNQAELIRTLLSALRRDIHLPLRHKSEKFNLRLFNKSVARRNDPHVLVESN